MKIVLTMAIAGALLVTVIAKKPWGHCKFTSLYLHFVSFASAWLSQLYIGIRKGLATDVCTVVCSPKEKEGICS